MTSFPLMLMLPIGFLGLGWPGYTEIIIIALVILLLFGGKKLPELARGMAKGLRLFKDELKGVKSDVEEVGKDIKDIGEDIKKDIEESPSVEDTKNKPDQQDEK